MKLITAAFVLLAVALASAEADKEEMMREAAVACMTELDLMKDVTEMTPEEGRCLTMCFVEKMEITEGGSINKEKVMAHASTMTADEAKLAAIAEKIDECDTIEDPDECTEAYEKFKCLRGAFEAEGLESDEDMFPNFD